MGIRDQIERKMESEKTQQLWKMCKEVVENIIQHNKQITTQMSVYDIHDAEHSEEVLDIIESILDDKINDLSCYELILIYMSAYLHDSAMAMPKWEYELLRVVEGMENCHDNTIPFVVCNDGKPVHKYSEAYAIISNNKGALFDYATAKEYICVRNSEEEIINSLVDLMRSYEEFRNGYYADLKKNIGNAADYLNTSKWIRREYIRQTHHIRVVDNVMALKEKIGSAVGSVFAEYFLEDLAAVCRCHGEDIREVFQLEFCRKDWEDKTSNIQFIALLLRLGDVIHFSSDRAPLSLFAEKQIKDETSYKHWNAKFQELSYELKKDKGQMTVKYTAYCKEPDIYYFIQDYLDNVDKEIDNYYALERQWAQKTEDDKYRLALGTKVDRDEIKYDANCFTPDSNMKFVLNQSKILELLMGVQLYKDKFLCLREIYQNALDASKCMLAYNKSRHIEERLNIEFGVGEEKIQGGNRKYIYCLDHGTGMNEYIIHNYLLHIGNSYYQSRDFIRENTEWIQDVKPTSQFGIGILSCYMLADKVGISTVCYKDNTHVISFIMEGKSEHFYYVNPSRLDVERLGTHGTLVKLYLKPEFAEEINAKFLRKLPIALMTQDKDVYEKFFDIKELKYNLFYLLNKHLCISTPGVPTVIRDESEEKREIYQGITIFDKRDYQDITEEDLECLWKSYHYFDGKNPYKEFLEKREFIQNYLIKVNGQNLNVYSRIALPKKGIGNVPIEIFRFSRFLGCHEDSMCVDGIMVQPSNHLQEEYIEKLGRDIVNNSILDFVGEKRPILSVDRNSCVNMPKMKEELLEIREGFIEELKKIIDHHLKQENIGNDDQELSLVFNLVIRNFPSVAGETLYLLSKTDLINAKIDGMQMQDLFGESKLSLSNPVFSDYQEVIRQILIGKLMNAEKILVTENQLTIEGGKYTAFPFGKCLFYEEEPSLHMFALKADVWTGVYAEYDLVSKFWPVVSPALFNGFCGHEIHEVTKHCKILTYFGNGIQGIANLDPAMIHPRLGISSRKHEVFKKTECYVGRFEQIERNYWLFELSDHCKRLKDMNISPALFAYISPRKLNPTEEARLAELEKEDSEYVKGVKEGWSILFLGAVKQYIIVPGIIGREDILKHIPKSYFDLKPEIRYAFPDGTIFDQTGIIVN